MERGQTLETLGEVYIVVRNDGADLDVYAIRSVADRAARECDGVVVCEPILTELLPYGDGEF